jgi:predicted nuclease of predicted toxin-antitoxin system
MRLLLDENLPKRLKQDLIEHEVYTVAEKGWAGLTNGKLLELIIVNKFDVLLTFDKNLQHQQNFKKYNVSVIVLNASDNSYLTLKKMVPILKATLKKDLKPGPTEVKIN